eukprot:1233505-Ditylum_brightwellii.AAC.1
MYTTLHRLKEIIHDGKDVLDNGIQPNKAANGAAIVMAPKAINYAITASFSYRVHNMIGMHNFSH